jgi:hypothetical protein
VGLSDFMQALLQLHALQRLDRKAGKNLDATLEFTKCLAKGQPLFGIRSVDGGRICPPQ